MNKSIGILVFLLPYFQSNGNINTLLGLRAMKNKPLWCPKGHFNIDQRNFVQALAKVIQPNYVLETGFCSGRSAVSVLLSCVPKRFISVDINLDYLKPEGRIYAALLQREFPNFLIIEQDSKKLFTEYFFQKYYSEGIDWLTIDGNHSYQGCYSDLQASEYLNKEGVMIIDDYKSGPPNGARIIEVTNAVNDFCINQPEFFKLEWNKFGKGFSILTRSEKVYQVIKALIEQGL